MTGRPEALLRKMFDKAVEAADPMAVLPAMLGPRPEGRYLVVGAGKASARMAEALETSWGPSEGLVITRDGYGRPTEGIEIVEASHPIPDERGAAATRRIVEMLKALSPDDVALALISGGASALLTLPAGGITLAEKRAVNEALLASGAPIGAMNVVRKHLSGVKGGQLAAAAYPARLRALLISDVPGDDPAAIGSGPTVGDRSTAQDAKKILNDYNVEVPAAVNAVLAGPARVLTPDDPRLSRTTNELVAAPSKSLDDAAEIARAEGYRVRMLGDDLEGEARTVAAEHARLALNETGPCVILSGGELTVTRRGNGVGGPNAEYALALAIALQGAGHISAIACDTDGVDGAAEVAGAIVSPSTLGVAARHGFDPADALARNDAHTFFAGVGGQVVTGPTLTNVNDFRAILIDPTP